ncbi:hypothetical protein MF407_01830 [Yimella sp. NH-Cas1]|nr:hypothetical protein [Yimella sp. NH-Cas1]
MSTSTAANSAAERIGRVITSHSATSIAALLSIALLIEAAQRWEELFPGAHALGEVIRALAYALVGALIFHWLVVQLPERRRARAAYLGHVLAFQTLVGAGVGPLLHYRMWLAAIADNGGRRVDELSAHDRTGLWEAAQLCADALPSYFAADGNHFKVLRSVILGVEVSLDGISPSLSFLHPDVAQALGLFPTSRGVNGLQIPPLGSDRELCINRAAHITWELLQGVQRLAPALAAHAPEIELQVSADLTVHGKQYQLAPSREDLFPSA